MKVVFVVTKLIIAQREVADNLTPEEIVRVKDKVKEDCCEDWNLVLPLITNASTHGVKLSALID